MGRYISIMVGADDKLSGRGPIIIPQKGFSDKLQIEVPADGRLTVTTAYEIWMAVDCEQLIRPKRFVQLFTISLTNRGKTQPKVAMDMSGDAGAVRSLFYAQPYRPGVTQDVAPGEKAFGFRLYAPDAPVPAAGAAVSRP